MAQVNYAMTMKDQSSGFANPKFDNSDTSKRKRGFYHDEDASKLNDKHQHAQKKRNFGSLNNNRSLAHSGQGSEDQDDEMLIRETQAALKSLSGSWPEARSPIDKSNESDDTPTFQNLFEEKNCSRKKSPTTSASLALNASIDDDLHSQRELNGQIRQLAPKLPSQSKYRASDTTHRSQYQSHDFNELVDDLSEGNQNLSMSDDKSKEFFKCDLTYGGTYANHHKLQSFSQHSAFRPLSDNKRNLPISSNHTDSYTNFTLHAAITNCNNIDKDRSMAKLANAKDEELSKASDSPDSKQYTTLQPAGVDSKAASVIQDVAREGVLSVAAVSTSSSPGLNNISSTTISDKLPYEQLSHSLSPSNIGKGKNNTIQRIADIPAFSKLTYRNALNSKMFAQQKTKTLLSTFLQSARDFMILCLSYGT